MNIKRIWKNFCYNVKRETVRYKWRQEELMMSKMTIDTSFPDLLREIEEIFRKNPNLKLHRYKPFRAWYKYHKEWEKRDPEFYAKLIEAGMTPHEEDPYYDPNAPSWLDYHTPYYMRDDWEDDDEDYGDDFTDHKSKIKKSAEEGFYMGIGAGIFGDFSDD